MVNIHDLSKKQKIIWGGSLIAGLLLIVLVGVVAAKYLAWKSTRSKTHIPTHIAVDENKVIAQAVSHEDYTSYAAQIITEETTAVDARGFYGQSQICDFNGGKHVCVVDAYTIPDSDDTNKYGSHRQTISVAWARYMLYKATGDPQVLEDLSVDIATLNYIITSPQWALQTDRFNCLLMRDLVNDDTLPESVRGQAKLLCDFGEFEVMPDSDLQYDQHYHTLYTTQYNQDRGFITDEILVESAPPERTILEEERLKWTADQLIDELDAMINDYGYNGTSVYHRDRPDDVFYTSRFITREVYAALDQAAAYEMNSDASNPFADADAVARNQYDFLLLLRETLSWYSQESSENFNRFDDDSCLLASAIKYYLAKFARTVDDTASASLLNRLNDDDKIGGSLGCMIADHALNDGVYDKDIAAGHLLLSNEAYGAPKDWQGGFLYPYTGAANVYIMQVEPSSWVAGILAAVK